MQPSLTAIMMANYSSVVFLASMVIALTTTWAAREVLPSPPWFMVGMGATVFLFVLPLLWLWTTAGTTDNVINGLFPYFDAQAYYMGAMRFLASGEIADFSTRRPLMTTFLAAILALSGGSLRATQLLLVGINGVSCFSAAFALWRSHGLPPALIMLATLAVFYGHHTGSMLSENLGLALGGFAFALLWEGAKQGRTGWFMAGLLVLSLALNARAGAMFVLPILLLWALTRLKGGKSRKLVLATSGITVIASGFTVPVALLWRYGQAGATIPFGNFAPILYGVAAGGQGWLQVYADHPHLAALPQVEGFIEIYRLAFARIMGQPLQLVIGIISAYNEYVFNAGWLKFMGDLPVRTIAYVFTAAGLVHCFRRRRDPHAGLVLWATLGILMSVPLLPDGGHRVYAATIPFTAALMGLGLVQLISFAGWSPARTASETPHWIYWPAGAAAVLTAVAVPVAIVLAEADDGREISAPCAGGGFPAVIDFHPGSSLLVVANEADPRARMLVARESRFRRGFPEGFQPARLPELVTAPAWVTWTRDVNARNFRWFIIPERLLDGGAQRASLCGDLSAGIFEATARAKE